MKRSKKIWPSVVASLLVAIGVAAWIVIKQLPDLITVEYETSHYESSDTFERIYLVADEVDVSFTVSPDGICRVECYEPAKDTHKVTMKGGTLLLQKESKKAWYEYFGVRLETPKITVSLPSAVCNTFFVEKNGGKLTVQKGLSFKTVEIVQPAGDISFSGTAEYKVKITSADGNISLQDVTVDYLDLHAGTGRLSVDGLSCKNVSARTPTGGADFSNVSCGYFMENGTAGDLSLKQVTVEQTLSAKKTTGNVQLDAVDARSYIIETDSGDVTGSLRSGKWFHIKTATGYVDVPKNTSGGNCSVTTNTGDVILTVEETEAKAGEASAPDRKRS